MPIKYRIAADGLIFVLIFVAPWWLSLILLIAGIFLFKHFYESLVFAVLLDGFHGVPGATVWGTDAFFTAVVSAIFLLSFFIKTRLRFY